jgi:hypothetical protein
MSAPTTFAKKRMAGRINATHRLFAFNKELKADALKEKSYWELNKDAHPINRYWYRKWFDKVREESIFHERINKMPVDIKYKLKKTLYQSSAAQYAIPSFVVIYFAYCWLRHKIWGVTPSEASMSTMRYVQLSPSPAGMPTDK